MRIKNYQIYFYIVVAFIVLLHVSLINLPLVNLEFAFISAAKYFDSGDIQLLDTYFYYQANTLGISYLSYLIYKLFWFIDLSYAPRIISISGIILLSYSIKIIANKYKLEDLSRLTLLLIILTNPIVWVYSGRGTADFFPMALGMFGFALLIKKDDLVHVFTSAMIIGISIVIKYHAIVFLVSGIVYLLQKNKKISGRPLFKLLIFSLTAISLPLTYIIYIKIHYGFFMAPPKFHEIHGISLNDWVSNVLGYLTYSVLLLFPISIYFAYIIIKKWSVKEKAINITIITGFTFLVILLAPDFSGEMNFGPLDEYLPPTLLSFISGLGLVVFALVLYKIFSGTDANNTSIVYAILISILIYLFMLSFTRPAQRYLIFVLLLLYVAMFSLSSVRIPKIMIAITLLAFMSLNIFAAVYQYAVGTSAQKMLVAIEENNLIQFTHPGAIESHVGDKFTSSNRMNPRYLVVQGVRNNALITTTTSANKYIKRTYSLIPMN